MGCWYKPEWLLQEIAEELGHHRAKEYNVGEMGRDTGVRYEDVAGIEHVKQDITDTMAMLTSQNPEFEAMGARPPRVSIHYMLGFGLALCPSD